MSEPRASDNNEPPRRELPREDGGLLGDAPGLVRVWAGMWRNSAGWTLGASREVARHLLGVDEYTEEAEERDPASERVSLRERGAELLRRSADVDFDEDTHPAYERILGDLAPDEARILRLLAHGPQASVDVRSGWLPISVGSQLLAPGLNMIGSEAGCRHPDRVPAYLNNLYRLGLIWFSRESLSDQAAYQVLEAQPEVAEAMEGARRTHTVRRSIHLTPFGSDFCRMCMPLEAEELEGVLESDYLGRR